MRGLPPEAKRNVVAFVQRGLRPKIFGGGFVCSLDWNLGRSWPRFVIPRDCDPRDYDLRFVRGLDLLVIHRPGHPKEHVERACAALRDNGARVVAPVQLPRVVK